MIKNKLSLKVKGRLNKLDFYSIVELNNEFGNGFMVTCNSDKTIFTVDTCLKEKITDTQYFLDEELVEFLSNRNLSRYTVSHERV